MKVEMRDHDVSNEASPVFVQVSQYGIKARLRPLADESLPPKSWHEVLDRVHEQLREFCTLPLEFVNETLKASCALVRGIGHLPGRLGKRHSGLFELVANPAIASHPSVGITTAEATLEALDQPIARAISCEITAKPDRRLEVTPVSPSLGDIDSANSLGRDHSKA